MGLYRNRHHPFEIELPEGWSEPGFLARLFGFDAQPSFYGPDRASLKFAIGHMSPEPSVNQQQRELERIVQNFGHTVLGVGSIVVAGREHATIIAGVPQVHAGGPLPLDIPHGIKYQDRGTKIVVPSPIRFPGMVLKNYSLIFNGMEYFATANIDRFPEERFDGIVKTFKLI